MDSDERTRVVAMDISSAAPMSSAEGADSLRRDPLTRVVGNSGGRLHELLAGAARRCESRGTQTMVVWLDLDEFKNRVNAVFGFEQGDEVIREFARRLCACVSTNDTVGRVGGDKFMVLLADGSDEQDAIAVARKVRFSLQTPFLMQADQTLLMSVSIGHEMLGTGGTANGYGNLDAVIHADKLARGVR
jgi:diguanylate cyclase (GGDEF)-like protein